MPTESIQTTKQKIFLPSSLYPFTLADIQKLKYGDFTLQNVFGVMTEEQRHACVNMWLRNNVLPSEQVAWQRTEQVCYFITESSTGKLVGVNTLYIDYLEQGGQAFYMNRMFIDPLYRSGRLMVTGTALMLCYAKSALAAQGLPGVINVNENRKLSRPGMAKIFQRLGYRKIGEQFGNEILLFEFANIDYVEV